MKIKQFVKDGFGWGVLLWFIGYALGIILFMFVPHSMIGWIITPIAIILTLWVLVKIVNGDNFYYYLLLAVVWTAIAIIGDYFFLVKAFNPADGYYKLDVYIYYTLMFVLPLGVGWQKSKRPKEKIVINK